MSKTERLIEIVRCYEELYDVSHEDYKNSRKKDKIWTKIGKELNECGEELKKKWKNLKDTYSRHIKCIEMKTEQGEICPKKWIWTDQMEYFRPFLTVASSTSNVPDISLDNDSNSSEEHDDTSLFPEEVSSPVMIDSESFPSTSNINNDGNNTQNNNSEITTKKINKKRTWKGSEQSSMEDLITFLQSKRENTFDDVDLLFLAHAKTIKKFSPRRQVLVKMKIGQLIMEEELSHLEELASTKAPSTSDSKILPRRVRQW